MSMAMSSPTPTPGSGSLISGVPTVVAFYEDYIENIDKHVERAVAKAIPKYERKLRKLARKKGWGRDSRRSLSVTYGPEDVELSIHGDFNQEYGTGLEPPRPVIRSAMADIDELERMVNKQIAKDLF